MPDLNWEKAGSKELMKDRKVLRDCLIDTHTVNHAHNLSRALLS